MIGVDSSVLLRYITEDDPKWSPAATRFIDESCTEENPGYINHVVLVEVMWTLRTAYGYGPDRIAATLVALLESTSFIVADEAIVLSALRASTSKGAGFVDCLIAELNAAAGAVPTYAIDKKAARGKVFQDIPE